MKNVSRADEKLSIRWRANQTARDKARERGSFTETTRERDISGMTVSRGGLKSDAPAAVSANCDLSPITGISFEMTRPARGKTCDRIGCIRGAEWKSHEGGIKIGGVLSSTHMCDGAARAFAKKCDNDTRRNASRREKSGEMLGARERNFTPAIESDLIV